MQLAGKEMFYQYTVKATGSEKNVKQFLSVTLKMVAVRSL